MVRISEVFARMADLGRLEGNSPPVIQTDAMSGVILLRALEDDLGVPRFSLSRSGRSNMGMYDGIAIVSPESRLVNYQEVAWLDYFGPLAEAFS
jgi:hypothetical protein